jgi:hypothetical protein
MAILPYSFSHAEGAEALLRTRVSPLSRLQLLSSAALVGKGAPPRLVSANSRRGSSAGVERSQPALLTSPCIVKRKKAFRLRERLQRSVENLRHPKSDRFGKV